MSGDRERIGRNILLTFRLHLFGSSANQSRGPTRKCRRAASGTPAAIVAALILFLAPPSFAENAGAPETPRRVLRFEMYPFIPDVASAAFKIKTRYESKYPDVELRINVNNDYYDEATGIKAASADVYELDTVFLADFAGKLQPLPADLLKNVDMTLPPARPGAQYNGVVFGLPHWLCSNFLVSQSSDRELKNVRSLRDVEKAFAHGKPQGLLIDLKGKSTLGELYLNSLINHYGSVEEALKRVDPDNIDPYPLTQLKRVLELEPRWEGRDETWHSVVTGAYARQFGDGKARALVTYSEGLNYALSEARSCRGASRCRVNVPLQVTPWPLADEEAHQVAWVDVLAIDKSVSATARSDAINLLNMLSDREMYRALLLPTPGDVPRYLLPARSDIYHDPRILRLAPLYRQFRSFIRNATPVTAPGLNARLRAIGKKLDTALPSQ